MPEESSEGARSNAVQQLESVVKAGEVVGPTLLAELARHGLLAAGVLYSLGVATVSLYYSRLGLQIMEVWRLQYMIVGFLYLFLPTSFFLVTRYLRFHTEDRWRELRQIRKNRVESAFYLLVVPLGVGYLVFKFIRIISPEVSAAFLAFLAFVALALVIPRNSLSTSSWALDLVRFCLRPTQEMLRSGMYYAILGMLVLGVWWYTYGFVGDIYPNLSQSFGGGRPAAVRLLLREPLEQSSLSAVLSGAVEVPFLPDNGISATYQMVLRTQDAVYLMVPYLGTTRFIEVPKTEIRGLIYMK